MSIATPSVNVFARCRPRPPGAPAHAAISLPPKVGVRPIVDAEQLVAWAQRQDARATLPLLVRRLIHAVVDPIEAIDFPAGESVQKHGFDGVLQAAASSPWSPPGRSVWEMGVGADPEAKADADYKARTDSMGPGHAAATFVFVTARRWQKKTVWAEEKSKEARWQVVRALDADDLEQWLDRAPAVAAWFARQIGAPSLDACGVDEFLDKWLAETNPRLPPEVLIGGREGEVGALRAWVLGPPRTITLRAWSREEAMAFLVAAAHRWTDAECARFVSRALIPLTPSAWDEQRAIAGPSFVCALRREDHGNIGAAVAAGKHVFVPIGNADVSAGADIVLGAQDDPVLEQGLERAGVSAEQARRFTREARGALHVVRSLLVDGHTNTTPPVWATGANAARLARILPLHRWSHRSKGDVECVEKLTDRNVTEVIDDLKGLAGTDNPPVIEEDGIWRWTSYSSAWRYLGRHMSSAHWEAFQAVAVDVLSAPDPSVEVDGVASWLAERPRYSDDLRRGVSEALAVAATVPRDAGMMTPTPETRAGIVVRQVLNHTSADWCRWAALTDLLPTLAEAAPAQFVDAVDARVLGDADAIKKLFTKRGMFSGAFHSGLLWALEALAWDASLLSRVAITLAKLQQNGAASSASPTPLDTLRNIFLGWMPQTSAGSERRADALRAVLDVTPDVGVSLAVKLLPTWGQDASSGTYRPLHRRWASDAPEHASQAEIVEWAGRLADVVVDTAATAGAEHLSPLMSAFPRLPPAHRKRLLDLLDARIPSLPDRARLDIWNAVRDLLHQHRAFADAGWALPADDVDALSKVFARLEPPSLPARYAHLFVYDVRLAEPPKAGDYLCGERAIKGARIAAVTSLLAGGDDLLDFTKSVELPGMVGLAAGAVVVDDNVRDDLVRRALADGSAALALFSKAFVAAYTEAHGAQWVQGLLADDSLPAQSRAHVAEGLPFAPATWDAIEALGEGAADAYWRSVFVAPLRDASAQARALKSLLSVDRALNALHLVGQIIHTKNIDALTDRVILDVLDAVRVHVAGSQAETISTGFVYDLSLAMKLLWTLAAPNIEIARQELVWLHVLERMYRPRALFALITDDPKALVEILSWAYRADDANDDERDAAARGPDERLRAQAAYHVLDAWDGVPGRSDSGVDIDYLADWVREVRKLAADAKRSRIADVYIGRVLARVGGRDPTDNVQPPIGIRRIIESNATPAMRDGIRVAIMNSRGVHVRSGPGGADDFALADAYAQTAAALEARWPTTASIFRDIEASYREMGNQNDVRAALHRW